MSSLSGTPLSVVGRGVYHLFTFSVANSPLSLFLLIHVKMVDYVRSDHLHLLLFTAGDVIVRPPLVTHRGASYAPLCYVRLCCRNSFRHSHVEDGAGTTSDRTTGLRRYKPEANSIARGSFSAWNECTPPILQRQPRLRLVSNVLQIANNGSEYVGRFLFRTNWRQ